MCLTWRLQDSATFHPRETNGMSSSPVVLNRGQFCLPRRQWQFLETFLIGSAGRGWGTTGICPGEVRDTSSLNKKLSNPRCQPTRSEVHEITLLILRFPGAGGWRELRFAKWLLCRAQNWKQVLEVVTMWENESNNNDVKTIFTFSRD